MNEITQNNSNFLDLYNKSNRLAAAVFMVSNVIDQGEELRTKIKNLSLDLVSMSVKLKDINFYDAKKVITDIEKDSLELVSMLDIAGLSGLISKMNGDILKEEFQSFMLELGKFSEKFESNKNTSVKNIFTESLVANIGIVPKMIGIGYDKKNNEVYKNESHNMTENNKVNGRPNGNGNYNGHKRKDLRKNTVLEFIKGHNNVSIKDIVPNINGCSEKTIQRELIELIKESKIKKVGERRWSRYSII